MNVARKRVVGGCELRAKNAEIEDEIWPLIGRAPAGQIMRRNKSEVNRKPKIHAGEGAPVLADASPRRRRG